MYLYPFLNNTSKERPHEYLRLTSLGVIGALVKVHFTYTYHVCKVFFLWPLAYIFGMICLSMSKFLSQEVTWSINLRSNKKVQFVNTTHCIFLNWFYYAEKRNKLMPFCESYASTLNKVEFSWNKSIFSAGRWPECYTLPSCISSTSLLPTLHGGWQWLVKNGECLDFKWFHASS